MKRQGFTLVEVAVALVILAAGMLTLQSALVRMLHQTTVDTRADVALQLVKDRIDLVRIDPQYDSLEARYAATETSPGGMLGLSRVTNIARTRDSTAAGITDYKRITVTVSGKGLQKPLARTVTVGAP